MFEKHSDKEGLPFQTGTFTKVNYTVRRDNGTPPYPPTKFRQVCLQGDGFQNFSVVPFTVRHNLCAEFFAVLSLLKRIYKQYYMYFIKKILRMQLFDESCI